MDNHTAMKKMWCANELVGAPWACGYDHRKENFEVDVLEDLFLNQNSINALLKTLEEPSDNNFFILINNQQAKLIDTISSRCLKNNIFLNSTQRIEAINYLVKDRKIESLINFNNNLTPGLFLKFNEIFLKLEYFFSYFIKARSLFFLTSFIISFIFDSILGSLDFLLSKIESSFTKKFF